MRVALTFDTEHPSRPCEPGGVERILDILESAGVRATFFIEGRWASAYPGQARRIVGAGHLVGNHSHHHAPMDALTEAGARGDVREAERTIRSVAGVDPRPWFRCPFGAGMEDPRLLALLAELGYRHVGWDVDPSDWEEGRTTDELVDRVLDGVAGRDDSVVLLHSWPSVTAEALPAIVAGLRAQAADLVDIEGLWADRG
jgi:peptidoglycan-N-acetylglucosamine deacetylase